MIGTGAPAQPATRPGSTDRRARAPAEGLELVTVVIPACNEADTLGELLANLAGMQLERVERVLVVDDGSTDGTARVALQAGAEVLTHAQQRGNGRAIKSAMEAARGSTLVVLDGDGQHDPGMIPRLLAELDDGADMVVASRTTFRFSGLARDLGNAVLSALASYMARAPVPDLTCGFRVFREPDLRPYVPLLPEGFSTPTTSTLAFLHNGLDVRFVPVRPRRREGNGSTHTRLTRDGPAFLSLILRVTRLFRPWRARVPLLAGLLAALVTGALAVAGVASGWGVLPALLLPPFAMLFDGTRRLRSWRLAAGAGPGARAPARPNPGSAS